MTGGGSHPSGRPRRTLAIDASTPVGTVAVFVGAELAAQGRAEMRGGVDGQRRGESGLMSVVVESLREAGVRLAEGDRIVCGAGPGSFTGLRVAASMAKGMAMGFGLPLLAVPSLALIAAEGPRSGGRRLATMDAMRGERYASLLTFGEGGELLDVGPVELHPAGAVGARAAALGADVIGADGSPARSPDAARALAALGARGVDGTPVALDGWEPSYGRVAEAQARWEAAHGRPLPRG